MTISPVRSWTNGRCCMNYIALTLLVDVKRRGQVFKWIEYFHSTYLVIKHQANHNTWSTNPAIIITSHMIIGIQKTGLGYIRSVSRKGHSKTQAHIISDDIFSKLRSLKEYTHESYTLLVMIMHVAIRNVPRKTCIYILSEGIRLAHIPWFPSLSVVNCFEISGHSD